MTWLDECDQEASTLTKEKRQEFMDVILRGKTLGEARTECGISFNAANGIIRMNIVQTSFMSLRTETI